MHEAGNKSIFSRDLIWQVALELFTVFIGVTLAFAFDSYRDNSAQRKRAVQLEHALVEDIAVFGVGGGNYVKQVSAGLARFDSLRAAGKRPVPFYLRIRGAERPPTDVWQAAMQSGAGALLDPEVMLKLAGFYNEISGEETKYVRYAESTEKIIFPLLESDTTAFYDAAGELKPEFKGNIRQLREILADLDDQAKRAHALHDEIAGRLK